VGRFSVVGIATCYSLDGPGIENREGEARFPHPSSPSLEPHPASYAVDTASLPGVQRPESDVDHQRHLEPRLKKK